MTEPVTRRALLARTAAIALGATAFATLGGCEAILEAIRRRPMRRNIATLAPNDPVVEAWRAAVSAMQALPATDPRQWERQAQIHQNFCPHGNWFFLPWHRAYLFYFERICRKLSGLDSFALPYWSWTCSRSIPAHFWGAGNALAHPRNVNPASVLPDTAVGEGVLTDILDLEDFQLFGSGFATTLRPSTVYGQLEATPHNSVHGWVGGDMQTFMSPRDPVFWAHHNMIEACWVEWNLNRAKPNPDDAAWTGLSLGGMFCDADGSPVDALTVGATSLLPLLAYQFDDELLPCTAPAFKARRQRLESAALKRLLQEGGPSRITPLQRVGVMRAQTLRLQGGVSQGVEWPDGIANLLRATDTRQRVLLRAREVAASAAEDVFVRVFVGLPGADARTPTTDPHYAGSFAFFAADHAQHHAGHAAPAPDYVIDVTNVLRRLGGGAERALSFQFVMVPIGERANAAAAVTLGGLELSLSRLR